MRWFIVLGCVMIVVGSWLFAPALHEKTQWVINLKASYNTWEAKLSMKEYVGMLLVYFGFFFWLGSRLAFNEEQKEKQLERTIHHCLWTDRHLFK